MPARANGTAGQFLARLYQVNHRLFIRLLTEHAETIGKTLPELLSIHVPSLRRLIG